MESEKFFLKKNLSELKNNSGIDYKQPTNTKQNRGGGVIIITVSDSAHSSFIILFLDSLRVVK